MTLGRCSLWAAAVCWVFSSLIAGCAVPSAPVGESKDRVTDSDETETSKRARTRMELATAYFSRGQLTTALDEVKLALVADPNLGEAYNLRGLIYAGLGDDKLAQESFSRALQINPRDGDTLHNYGWYMCQQKRYAEAEAMYQQALALPQYFGTSRTLLASGVCQARAGKWAEAEVTLSKAYERDPSNPAIATNLSEVLLRRGDLERARFYMRRVNGVANQSTAQTLWLAARIEMKLGNRQGANEYGLQLRNRFPNSRESAAFDRGQFDE
ncbi:MAG TPA: type IV pilus biogenesis/stability protein PilW [Rhizobacter sp.]|nr:type IV pilus biogenesis/stability protein PilW [Rhizobacter sp.]